DLPELRVVVRGLQAPVALLSRWVAANVDERVVGVDAKLRVALERNEVPDVGDPVPCVDGGRARRGRRAFRAWPYRPAVLRSPAPAVAGRSPSPLPRSRTRSRAQQ